MRFTPFRNFLLLWLQLGIKKFRLKTMKRQSDFTIWKISRDVVQRCSIRQRNAKKEIVWVFQDLVFKVSLAAMDPRIRSSSDQKIVKLGASWFPSLIKRKKNLCGSPDFKARLQTATNLYSSSSNTWGRAELTWKLMRKIFKGTNYQVVVQFEKGPWPLWPQCCPHLFFHLILCGKRAGDVKRVPGSVNHATVNKGARPLMFDVRLVVLIFFGSLGWSELKIVSNCLSWPRLLERNIS